jgi:glutamate formiminotransferase
VWDAVLEVTQMAVAMLDLAGHVGAHPRIGVVDVVPWVDLGQPWDPITPRSRQVRDRSASWAALELAVPSYLYGPERSLPQVRKDVRLGVVPDVGPARPHPTAGAIAVGARGVLVAYNLWLAEADLETARRIAASIRGPHVRSLGLQVGDQVQVSCNLIHPLDVGPGRVYDLVAPMAAIARAELVGLVPAPVIDAVPTHRWAELDLSLDATIESRLRA